MGKKLKKIYVNKYGVKIDYSLIEKGRQLQQKANVLREQKRQQYLPQKYQYATGETTTVGNIKLMSKSKFTELNDITFNPDIYTSEKQFKKKLNTLRKQGTQKYYNDKERQYKENFIQSIDTVYKGKINERVLNDFKNKIKRLSAHELTELRYSGELNDLEFRYLNTEYQDYEDIQDYFTMEYEQILNIYNAKYRKRK